jgi:RNA polymerase sigma factor (sigma-70 family)
VKDDDRLWFEPLVLSLGRPATKFANVLVHDFDIAEEIVQEAFARMWASPNTPKPEVEFRRYLNRIITNLAHDYYRKRARRADHQATASMELNPLDLVDARAGDQAIRTALHGLRLRERQAIYLRYFEDLSFAETARIMGARQVAVRVMVHRALGKLRREIEAKPPIRAGGDLMAALTDVEARLHEYAQQYDREFPDTTNIERRIMARIATTPRPSRTPRRERAGVLVRELAMVCVLVLLVGALVVGVTKLRGLEPRPGAPKVVVPYVPPSAYFSALDFVSPEVGWIAESKASVAGPTVLYRTTDGGRTWQQQLTWDGPGPDQVRFSTDGTEGLVVGLGGVPIFRTADAGAHWQRMALPPQADQVALLYFLDAREGWIISYLNQATPGFAGVFHTGDGGQHWSQTARLDLNLELSHGNLGGGLQGSLVFRDSSTGWFAPIASSGTDIPIVPPFLYVTHVGGKTWAVQELAVPVGVKMNSGTADIRPLQFFNQRQGVLMVTVASVPTGPDQSNQAPVAQGTYAYSTTDGGAHWSDPVAVVFPVAIEFIRAITIVDARTWVILDGSRIARTTDGGATWVVLAGGLPANAQVGAVDFQDAANGWAEVLIEPTHPTLAMYRTTDGGAHWTKVSVPDTGA